MQIALSKLVKLRVDVFQFFLSRKPDRPRKPMMTTPLSPDDISPFIAMCIVLITYAVIFRVSNISEKITVFTLLLMMRTFTSIRE